MYSQGFSRRTFLLSAAALSGSMICTARRSAQAQERRDIVVATWGGDYSRLIDENVVRPLLNPQGIYVTNDTSDWQTRVAKLRAEKDSRRSSYDVIFLSDSEAFIASRAGLVETLDQSKIPHVSHVLPNFRHAYSIPHIYSGFGVIYNKEKVKDAPRRFEDLLRLEFKGRVGFATIMDSVIVSCAALSATGDPLNLPPAFDLLRRLKVNQPRIYPSNESLATALKSGEIDVTLLWKARAVLWQNAGIPLGFAPFDGGIIVTAYEAVIPRNARNKDPAYQYLDALITPSAQIAFTRAMGFLPVVDNAVLDPALASQVDFTDAQRSRFVRIDYAQQVAKRQEISQFWEREFRPGL